MKETAHSWEEGGVRRYGTINGEPFFVEYEAGKVWVRHDRWSLLGHGDDLQAALVALKLEAQFIAHVYGHDRQLSDDALKMLNFVQNLTAQATLSTTTPALGRPDPFYARPCYYLTQTGYGFSGIEEPAGVTLFSF